MSCKLLINELEPLKDPKPFANTIYNNFKYLASVPQLQHSIGEITRLLTDPNFFGITATTNCTNNTNKIVGYLVGKLENLDDGRYVCYISYIYVAQKYRNLKVGSYMINRIIQMCANKGIQFLMLTCDTTDEKVYKFYLKRGFVKDPIIPGIGPHTVFVKYL